MITVRVVGDAARSAAGEHLRVGRSAECELELDDDSVSRLHLEIRREGHDYVAEDLGSANGTYLGAAEMPISRAILRSGEILRVGKVRLEVSIGADEPATVGSVDEEIRFKILEPEQVQQEFVSYRETVLVGRRPPCDVVIDDPTVSRRHMIVTRTPAGFVVNDQNSVNAVYLGDPPLRVASAMLRDGDEIRLGRARLVVSIPGQLGRHAAAPAKPQDLSLPPLQETRPSPEQLKAHLERTPLCRDFEERDWKALFKVYERDETIHVGYFDTGQIVRQEGSFDVAFSVVLAGEVAATRQGPEDSGEISVGTFRQGDFYGLLESKRAQPSPATYRATTPATIFHVPRHQIRYVEHNASARSLLQSRAKEQAWRVMAARISLFAGVPEKFMGELMDRSDILFHDKAGMVLARQGTTGDAFYIMRQGYTKVVQHHDDGSERVLSYLGAGQFFGEGALLRDEPVSADVVTAGKAEIFRIERDDFLELCTQFPEVQERVAQVAAERRQATERITPALGRQLDDWGQGYIQADALLVMDLELCVKCDLCVDACETLHGESRLIRRGMQLGKYLVPSACRHCDDPMCMFACPTGAIARRPEGEIYIEYDLCVGCGACAIACPYDNIAMIETNKFDKAQARKQAILPEEDFFRPSPPASKPVVGGTSILAKLGLRRAEPAAPPAEEEASASSHVIPPRYPIKCDLCDGLPYMGCVHACPTGAAMRVNPRTLVEAAGVEHVNRPIRKADVVE